MMKRSISLFALTTLWLLAGTTSAHHSFNAEFDEALEGTFEVVVREVWFNNPHARYYVVITNTEGEEEIWDAQTMSPNVLIRRGWKKNTIQVGDKVTLFGNLGRDGARKLWIHSATLEDGSVIRALAYSPTQRP